MPAARADGKSARPVFLFSVSSIGDLVLATLAVDIIARRTHTPLTVVGAPTAPALLAGDPRIGSVRVVRSSHGVLWRAQVLRHLWAARRAGATLVNVEVYAPRWRFVRAAAARLGLECTALDLPAFKDDNLRSAHGELTRLPHRAHYYAQAVGEQGAPPAPCLHVSAEARAAVERRLRAVVERSGAGAAAATRVVVHAGSTERARRPPPGLVAAALTALAAARPIFPVFVGAQDECAEAPQLVAALPLGQAVLHLCDRLPLAELPALIEGAGLFVGGDSGPLKIAEAVGAHTLSFWAAGATGPSFAGPRGDGHVTLPFDATPHAVSAGARALVP